MSKKILHTIALICHTRGDIPSIDMGHEGKAFNLYAELKTSICDRLESVDLLAITLDCWTFDN